MNTCAATGCTKSIPRTMLMCGRHWRMVPKEIQFRIWRGYRGGTADYAVAVGEAIAIIEHSEAPVALQREMELPDQ